MTYKFPSADSLVSQFRTEPHIGAFNEFKSCNKTWHFSNDILNHIESFMLYDEELHTVDYAIKNELPEVLKYLIAIEDLVPESEFVYDVLMKCARSGSSVMFRIIYENPEYLRIVMGRLDRFNVMDDDGLWSLAVPERMVIINYVVLKNAVIGGNREVFDFLLEDMQIAVNIPQESDWLIYYCGRTIEEEAVLNCRYEMCAILIRKGANAEIIFEVSSVRGSDHFITAIDSHAFDGVLDAQGDDW